MIAEIICIGDELLIGQVTDTNSPWIAQKLNDEGIRVKQITTVGDKPADMIVALTLAAGRADLIILTGGLGPTGDDKTKAALAQFFNCGLRRDEEVLAHVTRIFARFDRPMLEVNRQQADVLDVAEVLFNEKGTAPGMWLAHEKKHFVVLPGVPFEMQHVMENQVLPRLRFMPGRITQWHHTFLTAGLGESFLAEKIVDVESSLPPHISLAYLPKIGTVRLRLSARGQNQEVLQQQTNYFVQEIKTRIAPYFMIDGDYTLEEVVYQELIKYNVTLSTAESCTGGRVSQGLTQIPGISQAFLGAAVTYANKAKIDVLNVNPETLEKEGAVSEQTVKEMVLGAKIRFQSDYAIAISGVAGPGGGTIAKPVGLVWIAVGGKTHVKAKSYQFGNNRLITIERATQAAMFELVQMLRYENGE